MTQTRRTSVTRWQNYLINVLPFARMKYYKSNFQLKFFSHSKNPKKCLSDESSPNLVTLNWKLDLKATMGEVDIFNCVTVS